MGNRESEIDCNAPGRAAIPGGLFFHRRADLEGGDSVNRGQIRHLPAEYRLRLLLPLIQAPALLHGFDLVIIEQEQCRRLLDAVRRP